MAVDFWDMLTHLGESPNDRAIRTGQGNVTIWAFPEQDGAAGLDGQITDAPIFLQEDDARMPLYRHLGGKKIEVPATCFKRDGSFDWTRFDIVKSGPKATDYSIVMLNES